MLSNACVLYKIASIFSYNYANVVRRKNLEMVKAWPSILYQTAIEKLIFSCLWEILLQKIESSEITSFSTIIISGSGWGGLNPPNPLAYAPGLCRSDRKITLKYILLISRHLHVLSFLNCLLRALKIFSSEGRFKSICEKKRHSFRWNDSSPLHLQQYNGLSQMLVCLFYKETSKK